MQILDRFLQYRRKYQDDNDTIASSTSTVNKERKFLFRKICWHSKKKRSTKEDPCLATDNQDLLTQCIETALFNPLPPANTGIMNKRWSTQESKTIGFADMPAKPVRQRKLSLPPQYSNIGYLASIPEGDSYTE